MNRQARRQQQAEQKEPLASTDATKVDEGREQYEAEAHRVKDATVSTLRAAIQKREKYKAERAELERLHQLTVNQVLNATNTGGKETDMQNWTPADLFQDGDGEWGQREGDCYITRSYKDGKLIKTVYHELGDIEDETDMHITDQLHKALQIRDEAQAQYEQVLAEHREAYPWLVIEERKQPTEDMTDPANWRVWDWLECVCTTPDLTRGVAYQVKSVTTNHEPVIQDDDGAYVTRSAKCFRFYHRP